MDETSSPRSEPAAMAAPSFAGRCYILMERGSTFSLPRWIHCSIFVIIFFSLFPSSFGSNGDFSTAATISPASAPVAQPFPHSKSGSRFESRVRTPLIAAASFFLLALLLMVGIFKFLSVRHRVRKCNRVVVGDRDGAAATADEKRAPSVVSEYSWEQIQAMTAQFQTMVGLGGFSKVYLARISGGGGAGDSFAAVKVHTGSERLNLAFKQELDVLLHIRHENIVKLIGFCNDQGEGALVFEYMPNGNLQEKLHNPTILTVPVLSWKTRMQIAFQLARAIHYLHEQCCPQIVHGDIKSSNILLDDTLNCKLCDFGTAKMGFSSVVLPPSSSSSPRTKHLIMGSPGYTDPHYLRTGIASKKNDIYSFGVLILELITGVEAFCSQRGQILTSMPALREGDQALVVEEMVDKRLNGDYLVDEFKVMFSLARHCLLQCPTSRPSADDILKTFREKVDSVGFGSGSSDSCLKVEEIIVGGDK